MSNEMLEKVINTSSIGSTPGDGYLKLEQANTFIDHIFDAAVLWKSAEKRKLNAPTAEWPTVRVGARVVRGAVEGTDTGQNAGASFTKVSITTEKFRLDWEVTTEALEDNIEGESLDNHLMRLMTNQLGQDLEEISIWGDTSSLIDPLNKMDGWHKKALQKGHVRSALAGSTLSRAHFNQAIRAMPAKYMRDKSKVAFYVSTAAYHEYLYSQSDAAVVPDEVVAPLLRQYPGPQGAAGDSTTMPFGIRLQEVPMFDSNFNETNAGTGSGPLDSTTFMEFTHDKNRVVGMQRQIKLYKKFAEKKDAIEYTCYVRFGVAWQNPDAVVTITDIPIDETLR